MSKDPAFLLYSKDFYEGTRMMLPEERACYVDLMIYQHQNGGFIPNDLRRLKMYCSGIDEATLEATLEAKFKLCDKGWYNERLKKVVEERENFSKKQSINGVVGQFWKRANKILNKNEVKKLKSLTSKICSNNKDFNDNWLTKITDPKAMLKAMIEHLEDEIVIEDKNKEEDKIEIQLPFQNKIFEAQWNLFKVFRKKQHKFTFVSVESENRKLTELKNLSNNNQEVAIKIIQQSIDNGWKGLFELKQSKNGKSNNSSSEKEPRINRQTASTIKQNSEGW
ncbi:DUF1376 domain-containing protein [Tenacibaculum maritimum]|uniref:DUF1376 domain-containing protein n=1 Tax=Tenacibaculum maritimum TaxID=107401 RepID=UPI00388F74C9